MAEAIPGALIQLSAIFHPGDDAVSNSAILSFVFCILTAAFTSALLSWDWDTSKEFRKSAPWQYGYIPNDTKGKLRVFFSLYFLSAFNLIARCLACVLFETTHGFSGVAKLLGAELFIYLAVKVLRRDFVYWIPVYGSMEVALSFTMRCVSKIITDWTGEI